MDASSNDTDVQSDITSDQYSWYTETATGFFVPLSFKFGLLLGIQLAVLYNQRASLFRSGFVGKIPFLLQFSWLINVILWNLGFFFTDEDIVFWLPVCSNIFDLITKFLVIYFVCFRMIILKNIQKNFFTMLWRIIVVIGFILSILGDIPEFIKLAIDEETYNFLNLFYPITDAYISIIEIISLVSFIIVKFDCKGIKEFWTLIVENDLIVDCHVILASSITSFTLVIMKLSMENDIDYDLNFLNIVATLKYASSCNATIAIFKKTKTSVRKSVLPHPSIVNPSDDNVKRKGFVSSVSFSEQKEIGQSKKSHHTVQ